MNLKKKVKSLVPASRLLYVALVVFAVITLFFNLKLAIVEGCVVVLLFIFSLFGVRKKRREMDNFLNSVIKGSETAKDNTLSTLPLPIVTVRMNDCVITWGNRMFLDMFNRRQPMLETDLRDLIPDFSLDWMTRGVTVCPDIIDINGQNYRVHGGIASSRAGSSPENSAFIGVIFFVEVTDYESIKKKYKASRPIVAYVAVDNFDELLKGASDRQRTDLRGELDEFMTVWSADKDGILRRIDRDKYLLLFESQYLAEITESKFDMLEKVHEIKNAAGISAILSVGVGVDASGYTEASSFAEHALEMAQARGGDQAVIKNRYNYEFYGGRSAESGSHTRRRIRSKSTALKSLISDSSRVFIMGHKASDMDSIGAAVGMACICRSLQKDAKIVIDRSRTSASGILEIVEGLSLYNEVFITPEEAVEDIDSHSLLIVVDTNRPGQAESETLLQCSNQIAVIDHHRRAGDYIDNAVLEVLEVSASSACELTANLMEDIITPSDVTAEEATAVLAGIIMDTKKFSTRTSVGTYETAAYLKRSGADNNKVQLLMRSDLERTAAKCSIIQNAVVYKGFVAVADVSTPQDRVTAAQAADDLLNIKDITVSVVMYRTAEGGLNVSARSSGASNVQLLLEPFGGGGNQAVAGVQIPPERAEEARLGIFNAIENID